MALPVAEILTVVEKVVGNKDLQKMVLGEYSDGSTRSIPDAIGGEVYSPKTKGKAIKRNKKKKEKGRTKFKI